jgi:hypothetical protein
VRDSCQTETFTVLTALTSECDNIHWLYMQQELVNREGFHLQMAEATHPVSPMRHQVQICPSNIGTTMDPNKFSIGEQGNVETCLCLYASIEC